MVTPLMALPLHPAPAAEPNRLWLALILAAYLLLALGYGVVNPLFEAPDEHWHYFTAQTIAETGRLPVYNEADPDPWTAQEAAQPPLYYLVGSLLIDPAAVTEAREQVWPNPFARIGDASFPSNTNSFVHGPWEAWPWHGYVAAAHRLRILSTLLGLGTLLFIYGSARVVWADRPERALLAAGLVAFLPQFTFLHSAVSNDPMIIFWSAAGLWQLLRLWYGPVTPPRLLLLGVTIGLAMLSKMTGLLLLLFACGVLVWRLGMTGGPAINTDFTAKPGEDRKNHPILPGRSPWSISRLMRSIVGIIGYVVLPALLIGGWLLWRNWLLYGDITATSQFIAEAGGDRGYSLLDVLGESSGLWLSLFAVFGWFNVRAPDWVYAIWNSLVMMALVGVFLARTSSRRSVRRHHVRPVALLLTAWFLIVYGALVAFMLRTAAAQGRLLFPALVPLVLGLVYGLSNLLDWAQPRLARFIPAISCRLMAVPVGLALLTSSYCLFAVIPAAYARPDTVAGAALPASVTPLQAELGEGIVLAGAELHTATAEPGDFVWLTLYWGTTASSPIPEDKSDTVAYVVELFGRDLQLAGKLQSYHGGGLYPSSLWPPEQLIVERTAVPVDGGAVGPARVRVFVKLADAEPSVHVGDFKLLPEQWPSPLETPPIAQLGDAIQLMAATPSPTRAQPGQTIHVDVTWRAIGEPGDDYTTFIHLGEPVAPPLAVGDSTPLGGDYPTRYWASGELITDRYTIALPPDLDPGRYPLTLGMYNPETGHRLPLTHNGERQPNDAYLIGWLEVEE